MINWKQTLIAAGFVALAGTAQATVWNELIDAGNLPGTAQLVAPGTNVINGALVPSQVPDVDMFGFSWGGGNFQARTVSLSAAYHPDPMLSLFNSLGQAVQMDDDTGFFVFGSAFGNLEALIQVANLPAGNYFLALSSFADQAVDGVPSPMFAFLNQGGPANPGAVVAAWDGASFYNGQTHLYQIQIGEVPEPATLALLGTGLFGLAALRRRRAK